MKQIKVLIVDDVAIVRERIVHILSFDNNIKIIGKVEDPYEAVEILRNNIPDVIVLDIEMPNMDGLTFLKKIMKQFPIPVIILSGALDTRPRMLFQALKLGAVEVISKDILSKFSAQDDLLNSVKAASLTKFNTKSTRKNLKYNIQKTSKEKTTPEKKQSNSIIAIGSSTGGITAVSSILSQLSNKTPGIVIAQHLPSNFVKYFIENLTNNTQLIVKVAMEGESIYDGHVYVSPGDQHITISKSKNALKIHLSNTEKINHHRPSVDALFNSIAKELQENSIGIILTGMGKDGATGLKKMHDIGAYTIAQDKESSVVYGMPHQAMLENAVTDQLSLKEIPLYISNYLTKKRHKKTLFIIK
jgi:two-component system chemotaxis response regulator CheB